jgi:uncharacterized membrane protein (DUF2068 family)
MKDKAGFLKLIIAYKSVIGAVELAVALGILRLGGESPGTAFTRAAVALNLDIDGPAVSYALKQANGLGQRTFYGLTLMILAFGVFNMVEAWGLHRRMRWAEWLTVIATGLLIPYEIYLLMEDASALKAAVLVINAAIVYYLARHKELFKRRKDVAVARGGMGAQ